jgi:hypothetical protein
LSTAPSIARHSRTQRALGECALLVGLWW